MSALLASDAGRFSADIAALDDATFGRMCGVSWRDRSDCPARSALSYVRVEHRIFDGGRQTGELVVASASAVHAVALFARLWNLRLPIASMRLVDDFEGDDDRSMAANNSSAFNFRTIAGTSSLSLHSLGIAIDINPVQNPWQGPAGVAPIEGNHYLDRHNIRPGMFVRPGPVVAAFDELGWEWGGDWRHAFDYHHIVWRGR
jgi:hypothetical protein